MQQNLILKTIEYLDKRFPKRQEYAKGVAISLASALSLNSLKTDNNCPIQTRSNLYVLLCGNSNSGKTSIINYESDILNEIKYSNRLTDDITAESLPTHLDEMKSVLIEISEFTNLLNAYKKKAYMAGMREMLIKTYDGTPLTQLRSQRKKVEAKNYTVNVITSTQPITIAEEASETDVQSGFLPRYIWFHQKSHENTVPQNMDVETIKQRDEVVKLSAEMYAIAAHNRIHFMFNNVQLELIHKEISPLQKADDYHFQPFYDRLTMFTIKLAMLHQFMEPSFVEGLPKRALEKSDDWGSTTRNLESNKNDFTFEIHDSSVRWAIDFIKEYIANNLPSTVRILRLSDPDKVYEVISNYQSVKNISKMPERELYRKLAILMRTKARIDNAIELALKMELISFSKSQTGNLYELVDPNSKIPIEKYNSDTKITLMQHKTQDNTDDWGSDKK